MKGNQLSLRNADARDSVAGRNFEAFPGMGCRSKLERVT
jgi:hypothetical protein